MTESDPTEPAVIHSDDGVELTVTLLEAIDVGAPAPMWADNVTPDARLVGARLRVENTGSVKYDENIRYGVLLVDALDQQYEPTSIHTVEPELGDLRLEPGDRRAGLIAFLLPKSVEPAVITLSLDSGHGPDRALWKLVG